MKQIRILTNLILLTVLILPSCEKIDVPKDTPRCITKKIKKDKENDCLETVYAYDYREQTVFFFLYPCPEGCYRLVDEECKTIKDSSENAVCTCNWGGAFCKDDFWNNKTNERLIWQGD